jgi:hypothetical protein
MLSFINSGASLPAQLATFQTLSGASFVVNGAVQPHDSALTTASAEMKWLNGVSLAATFEGEFSDVTKSYAGKRVARVSVVRYFHEASSRRRTASLRGFCDLRQTLCGSLTVGRAFSRLLLVGGAGVRRGRRGFCPGWCGTPELGCANTVPGPNLGPLNRSYELAAHWRLRLCLSQRLATNLGYRSLCETRCRKADDRGND